MTKIKINRPLRSLDARVLGHVTGGNTASETGIATSPVKISAGTPQNSPVTKAFTQ